MQALWANENLFEMDAAPCECQDRDCQCPESYLATFPYPYMNGRLHLGHAFTITKAEFAARYQRLKGKRVLFPFSFHCTGMPIQVVFCLILWAAEISQLFSARLPLISFGVRSKSLAVHLCFPWSKVWFK